MSAPFDLGAMYAQFEVAKALELDAAQRRLSRFAAVAAGIALPALPGFASLLGIVCLIAQLAVRLHVAG